MCKGEGCTRKRCVHGRGGYVQETRCVQGREKYIKERILQGKGRCAKENSASERVRARKGSVRESVCKEE